MKIQVGRFETWRFTGANISDLFFNHDNINYAKACIAGHSIDDERMRAAVRADAEEFVSMLGEIECPAYALHIERQDNTASSTNDQRTLLIDVLVDEFFDRL